MVPITSKRRLNNGVAALVARDPKLAEVAEVAGRLELRSRPAGFGGLARVIVGQQLSTLAAASIWAKFEAAFEVSPEAVAGADDPSLRAVGLSGQKIRTLREIAAACRAGLDLAGLADLPTDEAHAQLTAIKGVGPWTADIYLMFCLGHPDIFPVGDLSLRKTAAAVYDVPVEDAAAIAELAEGWSPWRSVAAYLFWAYYGAMRRREGAPA